MNRRTLEEIGGQVVVEEMCLRFYERVLADPVLSCLFEENDASLHASRMSTFLRETMGDPSLPYSNSQHCRACSGSKASIKIAHERGRNCPLRDHNLHKLPATAGVRGGRFTEVQRQHWLAHMENASSATVVDKPKFLEMFKAWCLFTSGKYGPFAPNRKQSVAQRSRPSKQSRLGDGQTKNHSNFCRII